MMRKRKWLRSILILAVVLIVASFALSRVLQAAVARRYLIGRLAASFGRPVDVGRFNFSLLDGARLEALSVTVSEDPRFGNDYFLRAESLTAGLRWSALFSGRFEFGAVSLTRPSLNLVRDARGHWNIENWFPPVPVSNNQSRPAGSPSASGNFEPERLYRIDIDGGRIDFKQGDDKSGLALLDVSGYLEQGRPGLWQLDLEARPMRAGVELQDIGTLRLRGEIGGTSARLQPADLNLTWSDVSLADVLRLSRQSDYGVRGAMDVDLHARVVPPSDAPGEDGSSGGALWMISGLAKLRGVHGWELPARATDPSANLTVEAEWQSGEPHATAGKILIEAPNSRLQGSADLNWAQGFRPQLHIESSSLGLEDVLSWYRAFRPGVPEDLNADGTLVVDATVGGSPLRLEQGVFTGTGGTLKGTSLPSDLRIGAIKAGASQGGLDFAPTEISFSPAPPKGASRPNARNASSLDNFTMQGTILPGASGVNHWPRDWSFSINGQTSRVQDWLALAQAFAHPLTSGWSAAGGIAVALRGVHRTQSPATLWLGAMDFRGLTASLSFLNQPLNFPMAHVELSPSQRAIHFAAEAFGAAWQGTVLRKVLGGPPGGQWTFDLTADRLDVADLDRWLGPRARPGLLARIAEFGIAEPRASAQNVDEAAVAKILARGRLRAAEIILAPLQLDDFDGDVELAGRSITVRKAEAGFFGGKIAGTFDARLVADPDYHFQGNFDHVDLARLAQGVASLDGQIAGTASATLDLAAHGVGRQAVVASIEGDGKVNARNVGMRGLDFSSLISEGVGDPTPDPFASAKGGFRVGNGKIEAIDLVLYNSRQRFQAEGNVDFSRALDFRILPLIAPEAKVSVSLPPETFAPRNFVLKGTIERPLLSMTPGTKSAIQPRRVTNSPVSGGLARR